MKNITTGKLCKALKVFMPQVTVRMIYHDIITGKLDCFPAFGENSWNIIVPESIPIYLKNKNIPTEIIRSIIKELGFKS